MPVMGSHQYDEHNVHCIAHYTAMLSANTSNSILLYVSLCMRQNKYFHSWAGIARGDHFIHMDCADLGH